MTLMAPFTLVAPGAAWGGADEESQPRWFGNVDEDGAAMGFGVPDSDDIDLVFSCEAGNSGLRVWVAREPRPGVAEGKMAIGLEAHGLRVTLAGAGEITDAYAMLEVTAETQLDGTLRRLLESGRPLTVTVAGTKMTYDMSGTRQLVAALVDTCR